MQHKFSNHNLLIKIDMDYEYYIIIISYIWGAYYHEKGVNNLFFT